MLVFLGNIFLVIALISSFTQSFFFRKYQKHSSFITFLASLLCFSTLVFAYVISDFSVENVYINSHILKPLIYKVTASWGNHEGSMLLWTLLITTFGFYANFIKVKLKVKELVISFQAIITFLFLSYILITSNPFILIIPTPISGEGFNPLLQDIGLAIHPPILYMGYVGFSLVMCIALSCLMNQDFEEFLTIKKIALFSWTFLTLGIGIGSWWAYRELGWGGYWFWDPVENTSLMPWLISTALIHSIISSKKTKTLTNWSVLLSILSFIFCLVATFLVRSGLLTSVHSFSNDPSRGIFILLIISFITLAAIFIFFSKFNFKDNKLNIYSKEFGLYLNNILMITLTSIIVIGTIYPLIFEFITNSKFSVGAAYYVKLFTPITVIILILSSIFPYVSWNKNKIKMKNKYIVLTILFIIFFAINLNHTIMNNIILSSSYITIIFMINLIYIDFKNKRTKNLAVALAHISVAILAAGSVLNSHYSRSSESYMQIGEEISIDNKIISLDSINYSNSKNYVSQKGNFSVEGKQITSERRYYPIEKTSTYESAILNSFLHNIYIVIGDLVDEKIATRIYSEKFINLIWFAFGLATLSGFMAIRNKK